MVSCTFWFRVNAVAIHAVLTIATIIVGNTIYGSINTLIIETTLSQWAVVIIVATAEGNAELKFASEAVGAIPINVTNPRENIGDARSGKTGLPKATISIGGTAARHRTDAFDTLDIGWHWWAV